MSTGVIIALIVIVVAVAVVAAALTLLNRRPPGGRTLRRRFGPEYDRAVDRHDGDTKAAEADLTERVKLHGGLRERPLDPADRERFTAGWTAAQERFVDSPREAVAEADRLLGDLAAARGFPGVEQYEEQVSALSVHHGHHVHGYRKVHRAALAPAAAGQDGTGDTEQMREAMLEARALFEDLMSPDREDKSSGHARDRDTDGVDGRDDVSESADARDDRDDHSVRTRRFGITKKDDHRHTAESA
ncbi:hypothetical protein AB0912_12755 [Streptomyces sp. NPDC007084]|uniref:hypothetical protein n=1 Tax=Streptomyces sp. NPDC007084 TaxID=3154313 RepID=UPI003454724A